LKITVSVTPYHLCFTDEDLAGYDSNLKVNPPLRTKADREALLKAVLEGDIDCIASHHLPQDTDHKVVEFEYAQYGMTGLETSFAMMRTCLPGMEITKTVALFSSAVREIFGLEPVSIRENTSANLTLFLPDEKWTFRNSRSKSANSPVFGKEFTGKPVGVIRQDKLFLNE
jgi:dihydroorotase